MWWKPWPFLIGPHTRAIAAAIDDAIEAYLQGESSCIDIEVPFRHGKSDLVSRALIPYFLGRCQESHPDVILTGYGDSLVRDLGTDAKNIIKSRVYQRIFPSVRVARGSDASDKWKIENSSGVVTVVGLGGSMVGKGANLLIVDDY